MQTTNKTKGTESGQSLFEVLFAIAITAILITGIVSLSTKSVHNSDYARNNTLATKYAAEGMEWIRGYRDADWDVFAGISNTGGRRWCLNTLSAPSSSSCGTSRISGTPFWREVVLTTDSGDSSIINATMEVSWKDSNGTHTVRTISDFTKWEI